MKKYRRGANAISTLLRALMMLGSIVSMQAHASCIYEPGIGLEGDQSKRMAQVIRTAGANAFKTDSLRYLGTLLITDDIYERLTTAARRNCRIAVQHYTSSINELYAAEGTHAQMRSKQEFAWFIERDGKKISELAHEVIEGGNFFPIQNITYTTILTPAQISDLRAGDVLKAKIIFKVAGGMRDSQDHKEDWGRAAIGMMTFPYLDIEGWTDW